jgi:hypothetical protein
MKIGLSFALLFVASASMMSQAPEASSENSSASPPRVVSPSASTIIPDLDRLQVVASQAAIGIGELHIEKWKAGSAAKSAAQSDADSVQRNLTSALPGLIDAVRSSPDDVNAQFKLYRNLNALYDVFNTLTEATRVFGQKSEYATLSQQLQAIGSTRRKLGESLEQLTAATQNQLNQMRIQIKAQQEQLAAAAAPPKQIAVAQTEPPKKPPSKKKAASKKPAPASNANPSSSSSSGQTTAGTTVPKS